METLKVLDYSNVFIASYFTDDMQCSHMNREHTLIYIRSGELEINERDRNTRLSKGQCAFIRRDNKVILTKLVKEGTPYCSIVLKFSRKFLREFYQAMHKQSIPYHAKRDEASLSLLPSNRPDIASLFESIIPYFESGVKPSDELLKLKMTEGIYILLNTNKNLYASLFDFVEPWKIDILDYMNENYMYDLSMAELASYTGRSLATFKRDFKKASDVSPQKWLIKRRLEAAREQIKEGRRKISEICFDVGFTNLSHFSKMFKQTYGHAPTDWMNCI